MAIMDYGALAWKNRKQLGKREDLFESPINTLNFEPEPFEYGINDFEPVSIYNPHYFLVNIGNKNIIFSFYKYSVTICNYKEKKIDWAPYESYMDFSPYGEKYAKTEYEVFGQKFTIKPLKPNSVFLFESVIDGDKYEVLFGFGIDPEWYKRHIPEIYDYNNKMVRYLNSRDGRNYHLHK